MQIIVQPIFWQAAETVFILDMIMFGKQFTGSIVDIINQGIINQILIDKKGQVKKGRRLLHVQTQLGQEVSGALVEGALDTARNGVGRCHQLIMPDIVPANGFSAVKLDRTRVQPQYHQKILKRIAVSTGMRYLAHQLLPLLIDTLEHLKE